MSTVSRQNSSSRLRSFLTAATCDDLDRKDILSLSSPVTEAAATYTGTVAEAAVVLPVRTPQSSDRLGGHRLDITVDDRDVEEFGGGEIVDADECRPFVESAAGVDGSLGECAREGDERARGAAGAEPGGDDVLRARFVMGVFAHVGPPTDVVAAGECGADSFEPAGGDDARRVITDDPEGDVPVVEQLLGGPESGGDLVTGDDADPLAADPGVEDTIRVPEVDAARV